MLNMERAGRYGARRYEISVVARDDITLLAAMAQYPPPKYTTEMAVAKANIFSNSQAIPVTGLRLH